MYKGFHVKCPLFLADFNGTLILSTDFQKNKQISNFMKIRPVGAEFFHADVQAERLDSANIRFSKFCESAWYYINTIPVAESWDIVLTIKASKNIDQYNVSQCRHLSAYLLRPWSRISY